MTTTAPDEAPALASQSGRVEGWVLYYEYFHQLNADIQTLTEAATQRRTPPSNSTTLPALKKSATLCFEQIAGRLEKHDRPLVHIEDGADGSPKLADTVSGIPGGRTLTDADLELVRLQLRNAAHSSNQRAIALAEAERKELAELAAAAAASAPTTAASGGGGGRKKGGSKAAAAAAAAATSLPTDGTNSAAAIETQMFFGLALGEPGANKKKGGKAGGAKAAASGGGGASRPPPSLGGSGGEAPVPSEGLLGSFVDLEQLSSERLACNEEPTGAPDAGMGGMPELGSFDWIKAMSESGLTEGGGNDEEALIDAMDPLEQFDPAEAADAFADGASTCAGTAATSSASSPVPSPAAEEAAAAAPSSHPALDRFDSRGSSVAASDCSNGSEGAPSEAGTERQSESGETELADTQQQTRRSPEPQLAARSASWQSDEVRLDFDGVESKLESKPAAAEAEVAEAAAAHAAAAAAQRLTPIEVSVPADEDEGSGSTDETCVSQFVSPVRESECTHSTRRSARGPQPKRHLVDEVEAPLLKWEKEKLRQAKRAAGGAKRRPSSEKCGQPSAPTAPAPAASAAPYYASDSDAGLLVDPLSTEALREAFASDCSHPLLAAKAKRQRI